MMIQKVIEYSLLKGSLDDVVETANKMLEEQWQPLGAAFPFLAIELKPDEDGHLKHTQDVCQTMVKQGFVMVQDPSKPAGGRITVPQLKIGHKR